MSRDDDLNTMKNINLDIDNLTIKVALLDKHGNILNCNKSFIETFGRVANLFDILNPNFSKAVRFALDDEYPLILIEKPHRKYLIKTKEVFLIKLIPLKRYRNFKMPLFSLELTDRGIESMRDMMHKRKITDDTLLIKSLYEISREMEKGILKISEFRSLDLQKAFIDLIRKGCKILINNGLLNDFKISTKKKKATTPDKFADIQRLHFDIGEIHLECSITREQQKYAPIINRWVDMVKVMKNLFRRFQSESHKISINVSKFEIVGKILVGFFHEINNPLTSAILNAQLLLDELTSEHNDDKSQVDLIRDILHSLDRIKKINEIFREFAGGGDKKFKEVDLIAVVKNAIDGLKPQTCGVCSVNFIPDNWNPHIIRGNFSKLVIMLMNLIKNSIEAIARANREKGLVVIKLRDIDDKFWLSIEDNGIGMTKEELEKMFEPFFTTKSKTGLGYGLIIVDDVCREHKIDIDVQSKKGCGTQIILKIPKGVDVNENRDFDSRR